MTVLIAALLVAAAVLSAGRAIAAAIGSPRQSASLTDDKTLVALLGLFAPGISAAADNPRALLVWQPLAAAARQLYPGEFTRLDQAFGRPFPFTLDHLQAAHARWTTDWLVWERSHDFEFKAKAALIQDQIGEQTASPQLRARLDAVEREKLEGYQRRYEDYTRTSKALQALIVAATPASR